MSKLEIRSIVQLSPDMYTLYSECPTSTMKKNLIRHLVIKGSVILSLSGVDTDTAIDRISTQSHLRSFDVPVRLIVSRTTSEELFSFLSNNKASRKTCVQVCVLIGELCESQGEYKTLELLKGNFSVLLPDMLSMPSPLPVSAAANDSFATNTSSANNYLNNTESQTSEGHNEIKAETNIDTDFVNGLASIGILN